MPTQRASTIRLRTSLFQEAAEIVDREYASDLSLDDIARRVASSRRQLQRAYAEIGETTFRDHLTRVRMQKAAEMLATRALTVREVAHRVGYRQPAQFAKAFRRYQGVAPSDFRANGRAPARPLRARSSAARRTGRIAAQRLSCPTGDRRLRSSARSHRMPGPWALRRGLQSAGPRPERPHARADWRQMLGIGVVASILGIAAGLLIDWFPVAASEEAKPIDTLWDVLIIASVPVFVGVTVVVLFSVVKFRMRPGEENLDGPPIHGNTRLEVIWTAIPAILLVGLCTYAFIVLEDVEAVEGRPMEVRVVGEQFAWTFFYRARRRGGRVAPSCYLPIDRQVALHAPVQGRAARLLGAGLPHEEGRGAGHRRHLHASRRTARALPDRLRRAVRARARRRCARPPWSCPRPSSTSWLTRLGQPAERSSGGGGGGGEADGKALFAAQEGTAAAATRWPTPGTNGASARTSTTCSPTRTRPSSETSIDDPERRDRRRLPGRDHAARTTARRCTGHSSMRS